MFEKLQDEHFFMVIANVFLPTSIKIEIAKKDLEITHPEWSSMQSGNLRESE